MSSKQWCQSMNLIFQRFRVFGAVGLRVMNDSLCTEQCLGKTQDSITCSFLPNTTDLILLVMQFRFFKAKSPRLMTVSYKSEPEQPPVSHCLRTQRVCCTPVSNLAVRYGSQTPCVLNHDVVKKIQTTTALFFFSQTPVLSPFASVCIFCLHRWVEHIPWPHLVPAWDVWLGIARLVPAQHFHGAGRLWLLRLHWWKRMLLCFPDCRIRPLPKDQLLTVTSLHTDEISLWTQPSRCHIRLSFSCPGFHLDMWQRDVKFIMSLFVKLCSLCEW